MRQVQGTIYVAEDGAQFLTSVEAAKYEENNPRCMRAARMTTLMRLEQCATRMKRNTLPQAFKQYMTAKAWLKEVSKTKRKDTPWLRAMSGAYESVYLEKVQLYDKIKSFRVLQRDIRTMRKVVAK